MTDEQQASEIDERLDTYATPVLVELEQVSKVTLGKYAEDSADKGRYFE
ncbi:hypothetical protein GCM10009802_10080 [Streptomyces synnematoformans]|uniref:Uncharacterized protein n=2 Tax=Streptomyces synnematoformans TaxID=415721 RepID=A0ABN2XGY4_9ACTN